jgi:CHAT domain-containing protein/tetratricopeptide (TPR) repeat protein
LPWPGPGDRVASPAGAVIHTQADDPVSRINALNAEAMSFYQAGEYRLALDPARAALEVATRHFDRDDPNLMATEAGLAGLLVMAGEHGEAQPLYRATLERAVPLLGEQHPLVVGARNGLAFSLLRSGEAAAAEPVFRSVLAALDAGAGQGIDPVGVMDGLARSLLAQARTEEAEALFQQLLETREATLGLESPDLVPLLKSVAEALSEHGAAAASEPYLRRVLAIHEKTLGPDDPTTSVSLNNLALLLQDLGNYAEAETAFRRALAIDISALDPLDTDLALAHGNLAGLLRETGRYPEAEQHYRQALAIREAALGPDDPVTATGLNDLGLLLWEAGNHAAAAPLHRRALAIREAAFGPDHDLVAQSVGNLGLVLGSMDAHDEAAAMHRRALGILRETLGPEHPDTSKAMNNLAFAVEAMGGYDEAVALFSEALAIDEKTSGAVHPNTAIALMNLADTLARRGDFFSLEETRKLQERALSIRETLFGDLHPDTFRSLDGLAVTLVSLGRFHDAQPYLNRAVTAASAPQNRSGIRAADYVFSAAAANAIRLGGGEAERAFAMAQWPLGGEASAALGATAARLAAGEPALAGLVRQRQDLETRHREAMDAVLAAHGAGDGAAALSLNREAERIGREIDEADATLEERFPRFASLSGGEPIAAGEVADLLQPGEALVLVVPGHERTSGQAVPGTIHVVRWDGTVDSTLLESGYGLQRDAVALRCMVDGKAGEQCAQIGTRSSAAATGPDRGAVGLKRNADPAGFDLRLANSLHDRIFGTVSRSLAGVTHLIVVNGSDELAGLPFQLLVTRRPDPTLAGAEALRQAAWLVRDRAVSTLPSVASLRALRALASDAPRGTKGFLGVGDPVIGRGGEMACADMADTIEVAALPADVVTDGNLMRSASDTPIADVDAVRALTRLPDTRCELERIARSIGDGDLLLGNDATEARVKAMDEAGALQDFRVISFATHGLTAGSIGGSEPALVLTPPDEGTTTDDGLLTASEIAALRLNADWVILSACDTASGQKPGGENLSGLARAFFYAGSRTLLVSHWPVVSSAAVRITTGTLDRLRDDSLAGRAEAMRQATLAILDDPSSSLLELDPRYWAPFSLVGEGGAS